jgi:hypothetical protein
VGLNELGLRGYVAKGECAAFPQARIVALAECATHGFFDAVRGAYTTAQNTSPLQPSSCTTDTHSQIKPPALGQRHRAGPARTLSAHSCSPPAASLGTRHAATLAQAESAVEDVKRVGR